MQYICSYYYSFDLLNMKKNLSLFCALMLVLISCSGDDSSLNSSDVLMKKKVVTSTGRDNTIEISTTYYTYEGKKLVKEVGTNDSFFDNRRNYDYTKKYYYTGNLITKCEEMSGTDYLTVTELTYVNDKLKTMLVKVGYQNGVIIYATKTTCTHNDDGTVSFVKVNIDRETKVESVLENGKWIYANGNIIRKETTDKWGSISEVYEYDRKNGIFRNVTGANLLVGNLIFGYSGFGYSGFGYSKNNELKMTVTTANSNATFTHSTIYNYNKDNFPTFGKFEGNDESTSIISRYFY
jgi:hypothetical protein